MTVTVFRQLGMMMDNCLNWFIELNSIWQLVIFALFLILVAAVYIVFNRRNS